MIKTYPNPLVAWSINTLDEEFKKDMDSAPTIKSRIEAMKQVHDAGIRTTCFISPIFPGITDVFTIIEEIKEIFRRSRNNYGTRKIKKELGKIGYKISRRKIGRIMKKNGLVSNYTVAQYKVIRSKCNEEDIPNLLNR